MPEKSTGFGNKLGITRWDRGKRQNWSEVLSLNGYFDNDTINQVTRNKLKAEKKNWEIFILEKL